MADIHIERNHTLGIAAARGIARQWVQQAAQDYGLECSYVEGEDCDRATFARAGIDGTVEVRADSLVFDATLGFLFSNFGEQIEQRLAQNLDALLGTGTGARDEDDGYNDKEWT